MSMSQNDLQFAYQAIVEWSGKLIDEDGSWTALAEPILGIKLCNPEHGEYIGDLILEDGWLGFEPVKDARL